MLGGKLTKAIKVIFKSDKLTDSCKFALFIGLFNSAYKAVLCTLRRTFPSDAPTDYVDKRCAPIAGFMCGLTLALDLKVRRAFLACALMSRAIDTTFSWAEKTNRIPKFSQKSTIMFVLANLVA